MNILNVEKVSKTYGEKQLFDEVEKKSEGKEVSYETGKRNLKCCFRIFRFR